MQITNEKIEVTYDMMFDANMTRGNCFGIPIDTNDPSKGLQWKTLFELKGSDLDKVEEYFILKLKK